MDGDDIWRILAAVAAVLAAAAYVVGGLWVRVAGRWRDGQQLIVLHQLGPRLWGEAELPGGRQSYRGRVLFGRVKLMRADHGEAHLRGLGFDEVTWQQVDGRVTGHLLLRRVGDALVGSFTGRRFAVSGGRIDNVFAVAPVARRWERAGQEKGA